MDKVIVTKSKLINLAEAIRQKANIEEIMTIDEMAENIINMVTKGAVLSDVHMEYKCEVVE